MSFASRCSSGDHTELHNAHQYLLEGPVKQFLQGHNYHFHHINPVLALSNVFRKFCNGLIDAGIISPRHLTQSHIPSLKTHLYNNNSNDITKPPEIHCDSIDFMTTFRTTPISLNNQITCLAPASDDSASTTTTTTTSTTTPTPSTTTHLAFSFHGTKTFQSALAILQHGYNPILRHGQSYGPGEYHSPSFATAKGYGNYVICNLAIKNFTEANPDIYVTNNPTAAYHSTTYMLPLLVCCTDPNSPISIAAHVLPNFVSIPTTPPQPAPNQSGQYFQTILANLQARANKYPNADHSKLLELSVLFVEIGVKHYLGSQSSHSEFSHINPVCGLAPCFVDFVNQLVSNNIISPRKSLSSALQADSVDIWNALVARPAHFCSTPLQQLSQVLGYSLGFSFAGTSTPSEACNWLTNGYGSSPPALFDKFVNVNHHSFVVINLVVTHTQQQQRRKCCCPLGVLWVTNSTPLPIEQLDDINNNMSLDYDPAYQPTAWTVENHIKDDNGAPLPPNAMSPDVAGLIEKGYQRWMNSGQQTVFSRHAYLSSNVDNYFFMYVIDYSIMHQINSHTNVVRPVYRT